MMNFRRRSSRTGPRVESDRRGIDPKSLGDAVSADNVLRASAAAEGGRRGSSNDGGGKTAMSAAATQLEHVEDDITGRGSFTGMNPMLPQNNNSSDEKGPERMMTPLAFIGEGGAATFAGANPMLQGTVEESVTPLAFMGEGGPATFAGANPMLQGTVEESITPTGGLWADDNAAAISAKVRRRSARESLTEGELQQVLGIPNSTTTTKGSKLPRRPVSASTGGATVIGSAKQLGTKAEKYEEIIKFMDQLSQQSRATYVPTGCAEHILQQAVTAADEMRTRHQGMVVTLEATYRQIDERTREHYERLILVLQGEIRAELRRLENERKEREELVETLRDKIATQTAEAAAQEARHSEERAQARLLRENDASEFSVVKQNLATENVRVLTTVMADARLAQETALATRIQDGKRMSMQRMELEDKAVRATVAIPLESVMRAVEQGEDNRDRQALYAVMSTARNEADELRAELAEASLAAESLREDAARLEADGEVLREEARKLREELQLAATRPTNKTAERSSKNAKEVDTAAQEESDGAIAAVLETEQEVDDERANEAAKAMAISANRVAELEVKNAALNKELLEAQDQASAAATRNAALSSEISRAEAQLTAATAAIETAPAPAGISGGATSSASDDPRKNNTSSGGEKQDDLGTAEAVGGGVPADGDDGVAAAAAASLEIEKELSAAQEKMETLKAEMQVATAAKKKAKADIKEWIKSFEEREGRPPSNEEKTAIRDQFVGHKRLEKSVTQFVADISVLQADIKRNEALIVSPSVTATPSTETKVGGGTSTANSKDAASGVLQEQDTLLRGKVAAAATSKSEQVDRDGDVNTALSVLEAELKEARGAIAERESEVALIATKLEESERKQALFKTALGELNDTTTKMLADVPQQSLSAEAPTDAASGDARVVELEEKIKKIQEDEASMAEETRTREKEMEQSLQEAQRDSREAALAAKKSEHGREEALAALEVAKAELASCQLVVDENSEAARLRDQVSVLKADLEAKSRAATAGWDAAAGAESETAAAEARGLEAGIKRGRLDGEKKIRYLKDALAVATAVAAKAGTSSSASVTFPTTDGGAGVDESAGTSTMAAAATTGKLESSSQGGRDEGDQNEAAARLAKELKTAERELENLKEREKDAREEAGRTNEELERFRVKHETLRDREAEMVSTIAALEEEKERLARGVVMAQERADLATELVAAHNEEAAQARQEVALNAAKFRRVSRDIGAGDAAAAVAAAIAGTESTPERTPGGRPGTSMAKRRTAEQLRLAAATLVHAIKEGTDLWRRERREECHALYAKAGGRAAGQMPVGQAQDDLRVALAAAKGLNPAKAAVALRKAFDTVIEAAMAAKENIGGDRNKRGASAGDKTGRVSRVTSAERLSRGSSTASLPAAPRSAPTSHKTAASTSSVVGSDTEEVAANNAAGRPTGANSKVASLQRQLEALSSRQREADIQLEAEKALAGEQSRDEGEGAARAGGGKSKLEIATRRCAKLEDRVEDLEAECVTLRQVLDEASKIADDAQGGGSDTGGGVSARSQLDQIKIKSLESHNRGETAKAKKLGAQVASLEAALVSATEEAANAKAKALDGNAKKALEDADKKNQKLSTELESTSKELNSCKTDLAELRKERDGLRNQVSAMGSMSQEVEDLRIRAEEGSRLKSELEEITVDATRLKGLYQDEQVLRKKYWNMMEDMKGKIRVFARCRPFAQYEIAQDCKRAVRFVDESTVEVDGIHGAKQFVFDSVFSEDHGQGAIFEDTRNLVQSALDGFNVCVFAYGQTGSGKTWTMTGGAGEQRGLTPRVVEEIFDNIDKAKGSLQVKVSCYFIELYLDNLRDLMFAVDHPNGTPPKLEIKLDTNKMVVVKNVVMKEAANSSELLQLFTQGNNQRKVGGTKMNAESSRSHSVFSILLEVFNRTTKKMTLGKLSLVDLAGSERADKTGATTDRLKEAQSINKSLSALGDVISALSTGEKFIPYRNNKLTQVMQDSLGGNAKTLMFVNISPADYNQDETATALTYATRVKLITNTAEKQQDGAEVSRLKETIRKLKAEENLGEDDEGDGA